VTLVISKRGKDFVYFLQLQTRWWWWQIAHAVFTWTLNQGPDSMYGNKFHSSNWGNTLDQETLSWGKQCIILYGAMAGIIKNEHKMWENLRLRNLKSGFHCTWKRLLLCCLNQIVHGLHFDINLLENLIPFVISYPILCCYTLPYWHILQLNINDNWMQCSMIILNTPYLLE
jgi:hypothetical protein